MQRTYAHSSLQDAQIRKRVAALLRDRRRFLRRHGYRVMGCRVEPKKIQAGSRDAGIRIVGVSLTKHGPRLVYRWRGHAARPVRIQVLALEKTA